MEPTLLLGIDEFTMVLTVEKSKIDDIGSWPLIALDTIKKFVEMTDIKVIFGKQAQLIGKVPQGYTIGYQFGDNPFYFAIAYHPDNVQMGIVIKFSAYSWSYYCHEWTLVHHSPMNIKQFASLTVSDEFHSRLVELTLPLTFRT
ncbi:hypothetical protein [Amylolactobacillus amylophilus]|uniref:hypothetical protein n=1 Tax=Amylolactobacillus amylophilus TaxID=1603 RepID=UPI0006D1BDDC|nr:hypothetical protein [Amylolactobacillus amylophilus]